MAETTLFVTGLGRCGTTLVMNMLHAAGVPCAGTSPAFEDIPLRPSHVDLDWLRSQRGKAVKWIDPTTTRIDRPQGCAIFLSRDPFEQANSMAKLLGAPMNRKMRLALAHNVKADTIRARRMVTNKLGSHHVLLLHFDKVIRTPRGTATKIARFCDAHDLPFGAIEDAAAVVMDRSPRCLPDLAVEAAMLQMPGRAA